MNVPISYKIPKNKPDESLTEESIVTGRRTTRSEDIASSDELIALLQVALLDSNAEDRAALILHAIEGFTVEEIAAITDSKSDAGRDSIAAGRRHARASPPLFDGFPEGSMQSTD